MIELGLFFAFFLSRLADRWGRRAVLLWSIVGYTLVTTATAFAWDLWSFTGLQSTSRVFLGAEYTVAITMIVEEYPPDRRGRAVGRLLMFGALGTLAVALLLAAGLPVGPWDPAVLEAVVASGAQPTDKASWEPDGIGELQQVVAGQALEALGSRIPSGEVVMADGRF